MATVAALLAQYNAVKSQISFYTLEQIKWEGLHESMTEKVSKMEKHEESWGDAYDKMEAGVQDGKQVVSKGVTWVSTKKTVVNGASLVYAYARANGSTSYKLNPNTVDDADLQFMASKCVPQFDPKKLEQYTNLDMEYEAMQTTYETLLEELKAQEESLKTAVDDASKDTGITGS